MSWRAASEDQFGVKFVAFFAAEEGGGRLVIADFDGKGVGFVAGDVGRVGDYRSKMKWWLRDDRD